MTELNRSADVYVQDRFAGVIEETDDGYSFTYAEEYLGSKDPLAVSLTLPLTSTPYTSTTLFAFFDGLIPEGWLLDIASRNWKIDKGDRFGLLLATCHDTIGDVSIIEGDRG